MTAYTSKMRPVVSKARWELIEKAGFDKVYFAWSGADRPAFGHYYRVQGPTFVIEFITCRPMPPAIQPTTFIVFGVTCRATLTTDCG